MPDESRRRTIRDRLAGLFDWIRKDFVEDYAGTIGNLRGMSEEELEKVIPNTTDRAVYDRLIAVVEDASAKNLKQAELKAKIEDLGEVAVAIACEVPGLKTLFGR